MSFSPNIPLHITFHPQRTSTARIRDGKIVLRISNRGSKAQQQKHIEELIKKMTASWANHRQKTPLDILEHAQQGYLPLSTGITYAVDFKQSDKSNIRINKVDQKLIIQTPTNSLSSGVSRLSSILWSFLKKDQHHHLINYLNSIRSNWITEEFHHLKLKLTRSRWGSCDRKTKTIMLCLKLLLVDTELLHYVCVHELAHLRYSNHSKDFWNLVSQKCPGYKELRRQLNNHE